MPCSKCGKDKATPVAYKGKLYCVACAAPMLDDEHGRELQAIKIRDKIAEAREELKAAEAQREALLAEKATLEKRIAEVDMLLDAKNAILNQIDKLEADLKQQEGDSA